MIHQTINQLIRRKVFLPDLFLPLRLLHQATDQFLPLNASLSFTSLSALIIWLMMKILVIDIAEEMNLTSREGTITVNYVRAGQESMKLENWPIRHQQTPIFPSSNGQLRPSASTLTLSVRPLIASPGIS